MTKKNVMHDAVRYALCLSTGALALNAGVVTAQENDDEAAPVEEIIVTGSRISRSTLNTSPPCRPICCPARSAERISRFGERPA